MKQAGILNLALENVGGGPLIYRQNIKKSLENIGYRVLLDDDVASAKNLELVIGIETIPNYEGKPKTCVFDWGTLLLNMRFKKPEMPENSSLIGIFGDEKSAKSSQEHYKGYLSNYDDIIGCNLDSYSKSALDELLDLKRKKNEKPVVSVLFGGAPPSWISDFFHNTLNKIKPLAKENLQLRVFLGNTRHMEPRPNLNYFFANPNVKIFGAMDHKEYLDEVFNSDVVITKPGWLALSELFYFQKNTENPLSFLFLEDHVSIPESYAASFLKLKGFLPVPEETSWSFFNKNDIPRRTKKILKNLDYSKNECGHMSKQIKIMDLMKLILEDKKEYF